MYRLRVINDVSKSFGVSKSKTAFNAVQLLISGRWCAPCQPANGFKFTVTVCDILQIFYTLRRTYLRFSTDLVSFVVTPKHCAVKHSMIKCKQTLGRGRHVFGCFGEMFVFFVAELWMTTSTRGYYCYVLFFCTI